MQGERMRYSRLLQGDVQPALQILQQLRICQGDHGKQLQQDRCHRESRQNPPAEHPGGHNEVRADRLRRRKACKKICLEGGQWRGGGQKV